MTSIIAVVQVAAVLTTAILAWICLVFGCKNSKNSPPLKRDSSRPVVGDSASAPKANQPVTPRAGVPDAVPAKFPFGIKKDEADFIMDSPPL